MSDLCLRIAISESPAHKNDNTFTKVKNLNKTSNVYEGDIRKLR